MEDQITMVPSQTGKKMIAKGGYCYLYVKPGLNKTIWRCHLSQKLKCPVRLHATGSRSNPKMIVAELQKHNHEPDPEGIQKKILIGKIKNAAATSTASPAEIIAEQVQSLPEASLGSLPGIHNIKRYITRAKKKVRRIKKLAKKSRHSNSKKEINLPAAVQMTNSYSSEIDDGGPELPETHFMEIVEKRCLICRTSSATSTSTQNKTNRAEPGIKSTNSSNSKTRSGEEENIEDHSSGFEIFKLYQKLLKVLDPNRPNRLPETDFLGLEAPEFECVCPICAKSIYALWEYHQKLEIIYSEMDVLIKNIKTAIRLQSNEGLINFTSSDHHVRGDFENFAVRPDEVELDFATVKEEPITASLNGDDYDSEYEDLASFPIILPCPRPSRSSRKCNVSSQNSSINPNLVSEDPLDSMGDEEIVQDTGSDANDNDPEFISPDASDDDSDSDSKESIIKRSVIGEEFTLVPSQKGKNMISKEGYCYLFVKPGVNKNIWRCNQFDKKPKCPVRLYTTGSRSDPSLLTEIHNHSHPPDPVSIEVKMLMGKIKDAAVNSTAPITEIIAEQVQSASETTLSTKQIESLKRSIRKARNPGNYATPRKKKKTDSLEAVQETNDTPEVQDGGLESLLNWPFTLNPNGELL